MIKEAAILKDGVIYTGRRHCNILNSVNPRGSLKGGVQGFITDDGKIRPRRQTGTCAKHQRILAAAVKRARQIALLPFSGQEDDGR